MKKVNYYRLSPLKNLNRRGKWRIPALFITFFLTFFLLFSMESNIPENYTYDDGPARVPLNSTALNCAETNVLSDSDELIEGSSVVEDCGILVTKAQKLPNGGYYLCVSSRQPALFVEWYALQGSNLSGAITSTVNPVCFTFPAGSNQFFIKQFLSNEDSCSISFGVDTTSTCPENLFEVFHVDSCEGTIALVFVDTNFNNSNEYVVDWGDHSYTESLSDTITHTYCERGEYEICVTTKEFLFGGEPVYLTCCYTVRIAKDQCICDSLSVSVIDQICDTTKVSIDLPVALEGKTVTVRVGGQTYYITSDTVLCPTYSESTTDSVCISYFQCTDIQYTCCKPIEITVERCETADFTFEPRALSCINPCFDITPLCTFEGDNIHVWEMEDGTVFYGTNPPACYLFSNFVNDDNEVCVRHYILYCDSIIADTTICRSYPRQAIVGRPGTTTRLTDTLLDPNHFGWSVVNFIKNYATDHTIPLVIDGTLHLNISAIFLGGIWNMAWNSEIFNDGKLFALRNVRIQSADRDVRGNANYNCFHCVQASQMPSTVPNITARLQTLSLAPNPAGDQVQITWEPLMDEKVRIEMLSISGKFIRSVDLNDAKEFYNMNLSGVPPGSYLIRVSDGKHIQVGKLIIN